MRKNGVTLVELLVVIAILAIGLGIIGSCALKVGSLFGLGSGTPKVRITTGYSADEEKLRSASKIEIVEKMITAEGGHYDIYVNGVRVAAVSGKVFKNLLGENTFTLTTVDGKKLAYEKEIKRVLRWSRGAECFDGTGRIMGYFGEEKLKDLFHWGYIFHFYDSGKKELGVSEKIGKSNWNYHTLQDSQGNVDYVIDKKGVVKDKYTLLIKDRESTIPLEFAIFIVCIEDIIADSN